MVEAVGYPMLLVYVEELVFTSWVSGTADRTGISGNVEAIYLRHYLNN